MKGATPLSKHAWSMLFRRRIFRGRYIAETVTGSCPQTPIQGNMFHTGPLLGFAGATLGRIFTWGHDPVNLVCIDKYMDHAR